MSLEPNPSPSRVRAVIDRLVRDGSATSRASGRVHAVFPVGISPAEGEALRRWVISEKASQTLEVGLAYAISALHICEGLVTNGDPAAHHVVIDPVQSSHFENCGLQVIEDAGVAGLVEHLPDESMIALPRLLGEKRQFDLAFVDGNHRFDGVFVDLVYIARMVRPGGVVILDDYQLPGIARATKFFTANRGWTLEEVSAADPLHQWAVLRTSTAPDDRHFTYFVEF
jgi:predicted O-methyltransferase YrrM